MKKLLCLLPLLLALVACVGLETETTFNNDGSGTMDFTYRLGNVLTEMGEDGGDVDLPFDEASLRASLSDAEGVTVKSVESWSDDEDTYIKASISFRNIKSFYEQEEYDDMAATLSKEGGDFVYRQMISPGNGTDGEPTDAELAEMESAMTMMAPYFEGYEMVMVVNTPKRIKSYNMGELSNGGKTLTYRIPTLEMQNLIEETYLEIRW